MPIVVKAGVRMKKRDGDCAHPSCPNNVDFRKNEKLPEGWGTITFTRMTKQGKTSQTMLICPEHTLGFEERQLGLDLRKQRRFIRTIIESPFAGNIEQNLRYLRKAMRYCLKRGEAPYASHGLYTQEGVLRDEEPEERQLGIEAGFAWGEAAQKVVVYKDLGYSGGMKIGIERHKQNGLPIEERELPGWKSE